MDTKYITNEVRLYKMEEKMEKYEDKKNNLLMSINGKTIFKIDNKLLYEI